MTWKPKKKKVIVAMNRIHAPKKIFEEELQASDTKVIIDSTWNVIHPTLESVASVDAPTDMSTIRNKGSVSSANLEPGSIVTIDTCQLYVTLIGFCVR